MKKYIFGSYLIIVMLLFPSFSAMSYEIPKFKIIWRHGPTIGMLFNDQLSDSQIEQIIYELREIRKRKEFHKYFPATTPRSKDKYSQIYIEIFTDPKWATEGIMKDFISERMSEEMVKEYLNNTRGYYGWSAEYKYEGGSLGNMAGELASENYKELFVPSVATGRITKKGGIVRGIYIILANILCFIVSFVIAKKLEFRRLTSVAETTAAIFAIMVAAFLLGTLIVKF